MGIVAVMGVIVTFMAVVLVAVIVMIVVVVTVVVMAVVVVILLTMAMIVMIPVVVPLVVMRLVIVIVVAVVMLFVMLVVTMLFVVMPLVTVVIMPMRAVVMPLVTVVIMPMRVVVMPFLGVIMALVTLMPLVTVAMRLKGRPFAEGQNPRAGLLHQGQMAGAAGQRLQRIGQPWGQRRADPDDQIGPAQRACLGGAHGIAMGRAARRHDEVGRADPFHHLRHQPMHRGDICRNGGDIRPKRRRGSGENGGGERETIHGRPSKCYSITLLTPLL